MTTVETKDQLPQPQILVPKDIETRAEELPEEVEAIERVSRTQVQASAKMPTDDIGKVLTQTPPTQTATVTIPASPQQLTDWSKGSPTSALTWLAYFWLRIIKKALHFGWRIVERMKGGGEINANKPV